MMQRRTGQPGFAANWLSGFPFVRNASQARSAMSMAGMRIAGETGSGPIASDKTRIPGSTVDLSVSPVPLNEPRIGIERSYHREISRFDQMDV